MAPSKALYAAVLVIASLAAAMAENKAAAASIPALPLFSSFSYWDHHWIQWLPDHPRYEAIEVALAEQGGGRDPLIRLWLTERAGAKKQIYYFNDETVARNFSQESHTAVFGLNYSGKAGHPCNLSIRFKDQEGEDVDWHMSFAPDQPLSTTGVGLKPQNRHASASVLLFWYIKPGAITDQGKLTIAGKDYSVKPESPLEHGYHAAYDSGAYSVVLPYGSSILTVDAQGFTSSWGGQRSFRAKADGAAQSYVSEFTSFKKPSRIAITLNSAGGITAYRHFHGAEEFAIAFDSAVNWFGAGGEVPFQVTLGGKPIAGGKVAARKTEDAGVELLWKFTDPQWAAETGLRTAIHPREGGSYDMRVGPN